MSSLPPFIAPASFDDAAAALAQVRAIYEGSIAQPLLALFWLSRL